MTIIQKPNKLLIVTISGYLFAAISGGALHTLGYVVFATAGSIWSYLEITKGVNLFRKILGAFVLMLIFYNFFMHLK